MKRQCFSIAALFILLTGCATGSTFTLPLDEHSSLKVTEISRVNPVAPSNQYTVLWFCNGEKCTPKAVNFTTGHGWFVGLAKDAIATSGQIFGSWLGRMSINTSATGADGGSDESGGDGGDGGSGGKGGGK